MPKFSQRAPKDSKIPEARFISEDEDTSDTSTINCTTDDEEEIGSSAKQKKQHPAHSRKSSKTAESSNESEKAKKPSKKKMTKSAAVRNVNVDSDEPSQKATKKKVPSKRLRHCYASSGKEDEGLVPKVGPTCPKCQKQFEKKNNVRHHLIKVHGFSRKSEELS